MKGRETILIILSILICSERSWSQACVAPVIASFSPKAGEVGSVVTIAGSNFDVSPAHNQVYFGASEAKVLSATKNTLTVSVPSGATTAPVSVKNKCNRIGYSSISFNAKFCYTPITSSSFQNAAYQLQITYGAYNMLSQDMDLDGKPEVISVKSSGVTIAHNRSTPGNFTFFPYNFAGGGSCLSVADFDGDGKRDILISSVIKRNTSTGPGNISLQDIPVPATGYQSAAGDFNNDGKIDLVWESGGWIYMNRNTSTEAGKISFDQPVQIQNVGSTCTGLQVADLDGDGKTDIIATQGPANRVVSLKNSTQKDAVDFSLEAPEYWSSNGTYPYRCIVADVNIDGLADIVVANFNGATNTTILRNASIPGDVSFKSASSVAAPPGNYRVTVGDLNGDGYPEVLTKSMSKNIFSVYPNDPQDTVWFTRRFDYTSSAMAESGGIVIADLDGDHIPDIVTSGSTSNTLIFHRNANLQPDVLPPVALCKNISVSLSQEGRVEVKPAMIDNNSSDACGVRSFLINDQTSVFFTCADVGVKKVQLKVIDRAGNTSACQAVVDVLDPLGMGPGNTACRSIVDPGTDPDSAQSIAVSPNPSSGSFLIQMKGFQTKKVSVHIINALGQVVWVRDVNVQAALHEEAVDLKNKAPGIYQVKVTTGKRQNTAALLLITM